MANRSSTHRRESYHVRFGGSCKLLRAGSRLFQGDCEPEGNEGLQMTPREPRRKVMLSARMREGSRWDDLRILDISTGGLCLSADNTPQRGAYVELRRGSHQIIARVVWSDDEKFGVIAQDQIQVEALINDPQRAVTLDSPTADRRSVPRHDEQHDHSRFASRAIQASAFALGGACAALLTVSLVHDALARPIHSISAALEGD